MSESAPAKPSPPIDLKAVDPHGLVAAVAADRLRLYGRNELRSDAARLPLAVLFEQFRSPFVLILLAAAGLSFVIGEVQEGLIIAAIVLASSALGFFQEYSAANTLAALRARLRSVASVVRDGRTVDVATAELVPGDIVLLEAGSMIPADGVALACNSLHVDEAPLTGESFPVAKSAFAGAEPGPDTLMHMGTSVRSGTGRMVVTATGAATQYAEIAQHAQRLEPETSFARGVRRFGMMMTRTMVVIVLIILPVNVLLGRPLVESVLFAAALAVGLTPELLPAIVTVTLSRGARKLAAAGVLVRRLVAIENLGAMDVLCTDKTGTLTEGNLRVARFVDDGDGARVERWARINAQFQSGLDNPLDQALMEGTAALSEPVEKLGELPYDFERKCLSVAVSVGEGAQLVCKGAVPQVLDRCSHIMVGGSTVELDATRRAQELKRLEQWSGNGIRCIAVATRPIPAEAALRPEDEAGLTLVGYVLFEDQVKQGAAETVAQLREHGVKLKIISGDNRHVAAYVADAMGLSTKAVLTGEQVGRMNRRALARRLAHTDVFAEVTPDQKERIIEAYRRAGKVVGYLGDGINDAPALRAADLGLSVDNAVAAAREAADIVLLDRDLHVLLSGIVIGRASFANTLKYVSITLSANLGNMISMALASIFLPFLPLLSKQILINNFLADLPLLAVSTDRVDAHILRRPGLWDFRQLTRSMLAFGAVSSLFDVLTFGLLLWLAGETPAIFQTGWFLESLLTQLAIIFVMRTRLRLTDSRPSGWLIGIAAFSALCGIVLVMLPLGSITGFVPLPPGLILMLMGIVVAYAVASELLKRLIWPVRAKATS
ncbi:MAG: magnesium-translocating P-type ATPase [Devosia sp.]|uniref:magnesium-translocating P-type ATPase n=1 Tax=Devosia sp. TaxID=1871048 RepID=UPI001ACC0812|nr:magnesium-translocating P-type ATPase [Devosia sp.]MBN9316737.1 magnesium-translocating P-type ATPase [Devosia sp.]